MKLKKVLTLILTTLMLLETMSINVFAGGGGVPAILGETYTATIHGTLSETEQDGNVKDIVSSNPDCIKIISITAGKDTDENDIVTVVHKAIKITDETVTIDYKKFRQESGDWGTFSIQTYDGVIAPSDYLDLETSDTYPASKEIDQNYTLTQDGDTTYTDVTKVKLEWTISDIAASYTSNKTWDPDSLTWKETKTVADISDKTAEFSLTNYSSKKVIGTVSFKVEDALKDTLKEALFDDNNGKTIDTVVNSDHTIDETKKTNVPSNKITATLKFNADKFAELNATTTVTKYGTYTVTISATLTKQDQTAPSAPEKASATSTTVTLNAVSAGQGDTYYGYSTDNDASKVDNWKTELTFEGLTPNNTYYFFAKYVGNDNYNEAVSAGTAIKVINSFGITNKLYLSTTADSANATSIDENGTVTLKYTTDSGYPDCLGVKNATLDSYDKTTGTLVISNPTDDVIIRDANYLSFTANQDNSSVTIRFEQGSYEYSTNNGATWTSGENSEYGEGGTTIELKKAGDTVLVKGTNCSCRPSDIDETFGSFAMTGSISAGGSLTSVTDGLGIDKEVTLSAGCYEQIFEGCTSLTTAPELPATTLAAYCYRMMFKGCTALTSAPELPAKTLSDYCYSGMFSNCIKLTTAPKLSATTLANSCCQSMFSGCTALTNVPEELSATDLCEDCYFKMFENCTSLTTAPKLPAVNLEDGCYSNMFKGCTSLTTAPELSATNISDYCYWSMFDGCTALKITTVKPTIGTEGTDWGVIISGAKTVEGKLPTTDMFNGCICAPGVNATPTFAEGTTYYWYK